MTQVLRRLTPNRDDRVLVDQSTGDDAAVFQLGPERALVFTADFITPIVDDAANWGRIAAANSVSDIYAMGGRPLMALNLVGWNGDELSTELLSEVMSGAADVAEDAGMVIVGGHTVDDPEPKFGLAVVGEIHPDRILRNSTLQPRQDVVLTKPLGIGVIATAIKRGEAPPEVIEAAVASMIKLNDDASEIAVSHGVVGATDVTGFGLLGHLGRAAKESNVDVVIKGDEVPLFGGVRELADKGLIPGGSRRNADSVNDQLDVRSSDELLPILLADAQTSGGLVFTVDSGSSASVLKELEATGHRAARIGETAPGDGKITLL